MNEEFNVEKIAKVLGIKKEEVEEIINQLIKNSDSYPQKEVIKQIIKSLE